ncbi:MAG: TolC family protein [Acidobacteriota bacterium]
MTKRGLALMGLLGMAGTLGRLAPPAQAASAQTQVDRTLRFTVSQAVEVALKLNPQVLRAHEQIREFEQLVRQARSEALPRVDATLSVFETRDPGLRNSPFFTRLLEGPTPVPPEALQAFLFTNYVWRFEVEQRVYSFGRVGSALRAARDELEGVRLDVRTEENRISRDVAVACYGFLLAQHRLSVLETERAARERQLQQVQDRFDLEDATRLDLLRARVALANLRPEILAAENALRVAIALVNETLGRPVGEPIEVDEELRVPDPVPTVPDPSGLLLLAEETRPELLRFAADRRVLRGRIGVSRANLRPEIKANASYGIDTFAFENLSKLAFRTWRVGVSLNWTLFDGLRTPSEIGVLRSQTTQSQYDEDDFRSQLALELERATGDWSRALEAVDVAAMAVEEAREAERVAEESFRWGAATVLDILESERALRQAEFNLAQAAHDALVSLAEMKYLVGFRADAPDSFLETTAPDSARPVAGGVLR